MQKPLLVLDANAFIHSVDLNALSTKFNFISTTAAIREVKDQQARERLQNVQHQIDIRQPSESSLKFIQSFARSTGDIASVSYVDQELIALAYTVLEENGKTKLVRQKPAPTIEFNKIKNQMRTAPQPQPQPQQPIQEEEDDGWAIVVDKKQKFHFNSHQQTKELVQLNEVIGTVDAELTDTVEKELEQEADQDEEQDEESESEDDGEGWITTDNIQDHLTGITEVSEDSQCETERIGVAVVTGDFAMQNVLLQMGIPIISQEGMIVRHARRFILECHICHVLVREPLKIFCAICGNDSLLKVSCSYNSDGTIVLYRKRNFVVNLRGQQYSIPKNKKSRHEQFIRTEDQLLLGGIQQKIKREKRIADTKFKKIMLSYENGMGFDDIDYKQPTSMTKIQIGYGRLNPNDGNDMRKIQSSLKRK